MGFIHSESTELSDPRSVYTDANTDLTRIYGMVIRTKMSIFIRNTPVNEVRSVRKVVRIHPFYGKHARIQVRTFYVP